MATIVKNLRNKMIFSVGDFFVGLWLLYCGIDYIQRHDRPQIVWIVFGTLNMLIHGHYLIDRYPRYLKLKNHLPIHDLINPQP